ncbi:MAG: hypothetical protein WAW85_02545 [Gordonia sp. (in: high G+C Gram-positive bacteria)]|uniref:hypothetical protein n=1 Tax=Gordonia sp. (in: high G+C Gram-positive bacteria) TaxID=84139 RepID=UPI003BB65F75
MTASLTSTTKRVLATLAAAGIAGVALTACTPDEHASDVPGTTPPVITGQQAIPGDLVNADGVAAPAGSAVGTVALLSSAGDNIGAASFVSAENSTTMNLRVSGATPGQHKVEVRSGNSCVTQKREGTVGGDATVETTSGFTGTGTVIAGGALPGVFVDEHTNGTARQTVNLNASELDGKTLVLVTGDVVTACGVIMAN